MIEVHTSLGALHLDHGVWTSGADFALPELLPLIQDTSDRVAFVHQGAEDLAAQVMRALGHEIVAMRVLKPEDAGADVFFDHD